MIEQTTTAVVTCDACGKAIAKGEPWYEVVLTVSGAVFDGTIGNRYTVSLRTMQLCDPDYQTHETQLGKTAPAAVVEAIAAPPASSVAVAAPL